MKHTIPPVYDKNSEILILGSFPSVKSREDGFFYAHPQNRFWKILPALFGENAPPVGIDEKKRFLLSHKIALWDVIASCEVAGSSDTSIKNALPNDISPILENRKIRAVFANGRLAKNLYDRLIFPTTRIEAVYLPSTSPANASYSFERLLAEWKKHFPM